MVYLNKWEAGTVNKGIFLSDSTATGLRVTIGTTLSLLKHLAENVGLMYSMTSRLSNDPAKHIFGIIRQSSGCNAHPSPDQSLITVNCSLFYNVGVWTVRMI